jgi:hypothetical protein
MNTEALKRSVRGHGLALYDAGGGGDCQFRALHHQLASRELVPEACSGSLFRDDDTNSFKHQSVRLLAVVGMEDFNAGAQETALAEYRATHQGNEACTYDEFLHRMRQPGAVWGANASLLGAARQLASQVLQRPVRIRVHKEHGEPTLVTSWGDGQDPKEDTVVTLNLALQGETHYYSTVAFGDAGETTKRRREDEKGGASGSKRKATKKKAETKRGKQTKQTKGGLADPRGRPAAPAISSTKKQRGRGGPGGPTALPMGYTTTSSLSPQKTRAVRQTRSGNAGNGRSRNRRAAVPYLPSNRRTEWKETDIRSVKVGTKSSWRMDGLGLDKTEVRCARARPHFHSCHPAHPPYSLTDGAVLEADSCRGR